MDGGKVAKPTVKSRMAAEVREFTVIAVYLWICFTALAYLKFAILQAHGIAFAPFGFAAVKALICAKFASLGHALHLGERFKKQALIWPVLHKSVVFLLLLLVLNVCEEIIVGWMHGRSSRGRRGSKNRRAIVCSPTTSLSARNMKNGIRINSMIIVVAIC